MDVTLTIVAKTETTEDKYMVDFDESKVSPEELLKWFLTEYESQSFVSRVLLNNFFTTIGKIKSFISPSAKLLEIGCGVGISSLKIMEMLPEYYFEASEMNEVYINKMRESKFPFKVTQESVLDLQREDNSFDCIFLLEVLEHIEDYEKALSEIFRVSRNFVVLTVPNEPLWRILNIVRGKYFKQYGNTPGHINHWSPSSFSKLISKYGRIKKIFLPLPWIVVFAIVNQVPEASINA